MAENTYAVEPEHELDEESKWKRNRLKTKSKRNRLETDWIKERLKCRKEEGKVVTDAFGEIEFVGYGGKIAKYVRVDVDTEMKDMKELMMNVWGMDKPSLLISVTGGANDFKMSKRLKETFRRGLMKTALTTGAWIITGGTHAGVMKHVGEAVKDFGIASSTQKPVVTIGIAPWGCVQNRNVLINKEKQLVSKEKELAAYRIQKETKPKESFLDPNHSHFILVDNGTEGDFAIEIPFRVKLENEIAKIQSLTDKDRELVPIVLLVLAGGIGTLKTVYAAIQKNTPAVIVKGSGRVADILAYAYQNAKEKEIEAKNSQKRTRRCMEDVLTIQVKEMVEKEFGSNKIDEHMTWIKECLDNNDLLSVFELDSTSGSREIDVSMLQALLKTNKNHVMDQLRLALEWNRIDVAKNDIFTDDKRWPTGKLDEMMLLAIQLNRTDFVELFMDHGVDLREFLTKERLRTLYKKIPKNNCLLRTLLNKVKEKSKGPRKNGSLLDDNGLEDVDLDDVRMLMQELLGNYIDWRLKYDPRRGSKSIPVGFENPAQYLFIWSVLMIRQDMAKIFWAEGKDAIAGALVANSLLKAMKEKTKDDELAIKMQEHIGEWSNLAIGVLNECHSTDESNAQDLLVRELGNWGNAYCMLIAVKADNKEFISQTACKNLLNSIWMGKLIQENNTLKLLMCTLFPPLAVWLVKYRSPSSENVKVPPDTSEQNTRCEKLRNYMYSVRKRFYYFFNAPVIIFMYNMLSYFVFLGLFAYILLFNFNPKVSGEEKVLIVWVFTIFTEELRQVVMTSSCTLKTKLQSYITEKWNVLDLITIGLFIIGTILRFIPNPDTFEVARLVLAMNFFTFFLRLLHLFSVHKELGPKLVMIGRMVQDLMYFVLILMVFVVSYAIASHSIMFPNSPFNWNTINEVMRRSYWNIYGELFLDEIEEEDDCTFDKALWINGTYPRCQSNIGKYAVTILMGVYMLLANVLLLNLLIAMFSFTFQKIQDNTKRHWCYQRFYLIHEYYTRPVLCPPFIVFSHVFLLIRKGLKYEGNHSDFHRSFPNKEELEQWEKVIADAFHHNSEQKQIQSTEYKVSNIHDRMQMLIRSDEIQEMMNQQTAPILNTLSELKMPVKLDIRLTSLEQQIEWIIKAMQANNLVPSPAPPAIPKLEEEINKDTAG